MRVPRILLSLLACALCLASFGCGESGAPSTSVPAVPIDPVKGILNAFEKHSIVALDEGDHGNDRGHAFRLSLLRDSRFSAVVDDIVVEFGSARYQALLAGTALGAADFSDYYPFQTERGEIRNGQYMPISSAEWRKLPMDQQFDAVLYLGAPSTLVKSRVTAALCADAAYRDMRRERMRRSETPPEMDGLTPHCNSILTSGR